MCHIQRVCNSCGHINDHVYLVCNIAKAAADTNGNGEPFQPGLKSLTPKTIWDKISQEVLDVWWRDAAVQTKPKRSTNSLTLL
ncbi:hypothetical protein BO79DRAFT_252141 [Aspergillus costaricaensis CBS 115574]|uniref:Uncharacterized protein n=1 Tax=Aspergillus costaricaensis CBS 115574 TaxID=1448317 RepID=A0ACD1INK9_9EURO|nr:hypothetical protein BO79DRAFT_252141 [Aspergillus costaricaensis CBS 115574]RAK92069.1 hypothetical protein BO79DRAFT_252141 [Aspergillus costaricaensis CBS 115574]